MTDEKMYDIINGNISFDSIEELEAYKQFFGKLEVSLTYDDGTYKTVYDIFKEASCNFQKKKNLNNTLDIVSEEVI